MKPENYVTFYKIKLDNPVPDTTLDCSSVHSSNQ